MHLVHHGVESEIPIRSENTKRAHQMTTAKYKEYIC